MEVGKLKRRMDWAGLLVRVRHDTQTGGGAYFPAGTLMIVAMASHKGLELMSPPCAHCGTAGNRITQVSERDVIIESRVAPPCRWGYTRIEVKDLWPGEIQ